MKRSATKPTANFQPQISAYAATETSIDAEVVSTFAFGRSSNAALPHLSSASSPTKSGPVKRRSPVRRGGGEAGREGSGTGCGASGGSHRDWGRSIAAIQCGEDG